MAHGRLSDLLSQWETAAGAVSQESQARLAVAAVPITALDPLVAFAAAHEDAFFWEHPAAGLTMTGIHPTLVLTDGADSSGAPILSVGGHWRALAESAEILTDSLPFTPVPLSMGGFRFDPKRAPDATWSSFAGDAWNVPSLVVARREEHSWLQLQALVPPDTSPSDLARTIGTRAEALLDHIAKTSGDGPAEQEPGPQDLITTEDPSAEWWRQTVADVLDEIAHEKLSKLVLARRMQAQAESPFQIAAILHRLRNDHPAATTFAVRRGTACFLGASPERLVSLQDGVVRTTAIAGTAARTNDTGATFAHDPKERREHAYVVEAIREALAPLCRDLCIAEAPQVLDLPTLRHLTTPIQGVLRTPTTVLDLAARLHPTPAVGGVPLPEAAAWLRAHEPFDRGWYAGPVGWMDGNGDGELVVALRSALVDGSHATLFGGCGLVEGSDADREWAEARLKMETALRALRG